MLSDRTRNRRLCRSISRAVVALAAVVAVLGGRPSAGRADDDSGWRITVDVLVEGFHARNIALFRKVDGGIRPFEQICSGVLEVPDAVKGCAVTVELPKPGPAPKTGGAPADALADAKGATDASGGAPPSTPQALLFEILPVSSRTATQILARFGRVTFKCPDQPESEVDPLVYYLYEPKRLNDEEILAVYRGAGFKRMIFLSPKVFKKRKIDFPLRPEFLRNGGPEPQRTKGELRLDIERVRDLGAFDRKPHAPRCRKR